MPAKLVKSARVERLLITCSRKGLTDFYYGLLPSWDQTIELVENINTRFSVSSFIKQVEKLSEDQRNAITRMGFGHLLVMPNQRLSKTLLAELMERWCCDRKAFELPPGEIRISIMDVALILGLRVIGQFVVLKDDEPFSDLEKEYGATAGKREITVASIEKRLESLNMMVNENFIRTFLLFTFGVLLFPNADGTLDSRYLSLLKDLDKVPRYAWGAAVLEDLHTWLGRRRQEMIEYVGGCLVFLQIWSYAHIDIARPLYQGRSLPFPRSCQWKNSTSYTRQWFKTKFEKLQRNQITWQLDPTPEESQIDIIRELLEVQNDNMEFPTSPHSSRIDIVGDVDDLRAQNLVSEREVLELEEEPIVDIIQELTEAEKDNTELPSTSQNSSTNDTVDGDNLRTKNQMLENQVVELEKKVDDLRRENQILRSQLLSFNNFADRLERIVLDEDANEEREDTLKK